MITEKHLDKINNVISILFCAKGNIEQSLEDELKERIISQEIAFKQLEDAKTKIDLIMKEF